MKRQNALAHPIALSTLLIFCAPFYASSQTVRSWSTTLSLERKLSEQVPLEFGPALDFGATRITVDDSKTYQRILGMGSSFDHSTCFNLSKLSPTDRDSVLRNMLGPSPGIGLNLMRVCIGTSDFTGDPWYSYDDMPPGKTDLELSHFNIDKDRAYILPMLKQARKTSPNLQFFASPWSPPGWMKSSGNMIGGRLLPKWYGTYARYFVKFIKAYEAEGIPIYAVTVQNEPGVDREKQPKMRYPSCKWTAEEERDFIKGHLGPAFLKAGLKTRIWCYDHNFNIKPDKENAGIAYPRTILKDPVAAKFVDAVGFHGYAGESSGMTAFHEEFPKATIRFTEGSVFDMWGGERLVDLVRNWASSYNAWVAMLDTNGKPNNGPFEAGRTMVMRDAKANRPKYLFEYYLLGQFSAFVKHGAVRIGSEGDGPIKHVAFQNPDGQLILIVVNAGEKPLPFQVRWRGQGINAYSEPTSLITFTWRPN